MLTKSTFWIDSDATRLNLYYCLGVHQRLSKFEKFRGDLMKHGQLLIVSSCAVLHSISKILLRMTNFVDIRACAKLRSFGLVQIRVQSSKISLKLKGLHGSNSLHWKSNLYENLWLPSNHSRECASFHSRPWLTRRLDQSSPLSIQFHLCTFWVHLRSWSNAVSVLLSRQLHSGCALTKTPHVGGYSTRTQLGCGVEIRDGADWCGWRMKASGADCVQCHVGSNFVSNFFSSSLKPKPVCLDKVPHCEQMHIRLPLYGHFYLKLRNGLALFQSGGRENCLLKGVLVKSLFWLCLSPAFSNQRCTILVFRHSVLGDRRRLTPNFLGHTCANLRKIWGNQKRHLRFGGLNLMFSEDPRLMRR